ncbi:S24 family peptidase [Agrobacterium pusense]|uniref:S24 family peptidase n=1 Tax=Agrobacterium pusense TaxID=648995 RepID=UPI00051416BE|nr:S24 family peptidase [Agrobacterium pusense]ANV25273.1 repressor [Rhizobium sp. S41]KGE82706.1 repressor [Rhizobium sp. H41]QWW74473.1 XRE family transcriptional regulator [Agrobacterium pusense]
MSNILISRINQRLGELGKSASRVSIEATGAKETLRKILDGTTKNPRVDTIEKVAAALETTSEWLQGKSEQISASEVVKSDVTPASAVLPDRQSMPNDVPVMGTAAGSHTKGAFQLLPGPVDYVRRPPALANVRGLYSLFVEGTSMVPQYYPGDLIYVNPNKPARFGDAVVIQCRDHHEDGFEGTIGVYLKRTETHITIQKHNPPAEIKISREIIVNVHKILTMNEIFGV